MVMNGRSQVNGFNHNSGPTPRPRNKPQLPSLPKVKALYDYSPQDLDELGLKEGDIIEVLKERKFQTFERINNFSEYMPQNVLN